MSEQQHGRDSAWRLAARYGDADAEEHGVLECVRRQGVDTDEFQHIADQRALRIILQQRGIAPAELTHLQVFRLTPLEQEIHKLLVTVYMDGLYIGWRARALAREEGEA